MIRRRTAIFYIVELGRRPYNDNVDWRELTIESVIINIIPLHKSMLHNNDVILHSNIYLNYS